MKRLSMKHLVAAATFFVAPAAMSQAYGRVIITNYSLKRVNVVVNYAACRSDRFLVSQGRMEGGKVVPGVNQAQSRRGACLVTSITGTYEGNDKEPILPYEHAATTYSHFYIKKPAFNNGDTFRIWSANSFAADSEPIAKFNANRDKKNP